MPTLREAISLVRAELSAPLAPFTNAPSDLQIADELMSEYQHSINQIGNKSTARHSGTATLSVVAGTRAYQVSDAAFGKPLLVTTVPTDNNVYPEYPLEFTELEQIGREWAWLDNANGSLWYSNHSAYYIAFYTKFGSGGIENWCEIRPTPDKAETYKILYTIGDASSYFGLIKALPYPEFTRFFTANTAINLLPKTMWSNDMQVNLAKGQMLLPTLMDKRERYGREWDTHKDTLNHSDIVYADGYGYE